MNHKVNREYLSWKENWMHVNDPDIFKDVSSWFKSVNRKYNTGRDNLL